MGAISSRGSLGAGAFGRRSVLAGAHAEVPAELAAEVVRGVEADLPCDGAYVVDRMLEEPGGLAQPKADHRSHHGVSDLLLEEVREPRRRERDLPRKPWHVVPGGEVGGDDIQDPPHPRIYRTPTGAFPHREQQNLLKTVERKLARELARCEGIRVQPEKGTPCPLPGSPGLKTRQTEPFAADKWAPPPQPFDAGLEMCPQELPETPLRHGVIVLGVRSEQHDVARLHEEVRTGLPIEPPSIQRVREEPVPRTIGPTHPVSVPHAEMAGDEYARWGRWDLWCAHSRIVQLFSHRAYSLDRAPGLASRV